MKIGAFDMQCGEIVSHSCSVFRIAAGGIRVLKRTRGGQPKRQKRGSLAWSVPVREYTYPLSNVLCGSQNMCHGKSLTTFSSYGSEILVYISHSTPSLNLVPRGSHYWIKIYMRYNNNKYK